MISVIIPCRNQGRYLRTAVESVLVQSYGEHEIIIFDDASTDDTAEVIKQLVKENPGREFSIRGNDRNMGLSLARNEMIGIAKGDLIMPLDADDFLHPDCLQEMMLVLKSRKDVDVVSASRINFGARCELIHANPVYPDLLPLENQLGYASMFRKSVWEKVGGYQANLPHQGMEDWEFWLSALEAGCKFSPIRKVLWHYRVHPGMAGKVIANYEWYFARMALRHTKHYSPETLRRCESVMAGGPPI